MTTGSGGATADSGFTEYFGHLETTGFGLQALLELSSQRWPLSSQAGVSSYGGNVTNMMGVVAMPVRMARQSIILGRNF
jgi:hypothetical protein